MEKTDSQSENDSTESMKKTLYSELKNKAIGLLARREYSSQELTSKLLSHSHSHSMPMDDVAIIVADVIEQLQGLGYQSDYRFTAMFIRHKAQTGNGPLKISRELSFKGGDRALFDQVVEEEQIDFFENALALMQRKFSIEQLKDYQAYQKAFRYLANRGFTTDQIKYAKETLLEAE
ncbi:regulatory protein RecX [Litoribrevibacter albus]|uniref:Regulatory protein RecX n=1 Tax=Litoribrevibacter albus TaxID=1473156 RepID=A0AA37W7B1_9GAMM|nr:regulatory protein RecX [Litoribrevibacter albus]GLQ31138.1 recombination regulator RecX [Litoribrevibacter albus]